MANTPVLLLPGWQGSGPEHWQSHWETEHGDLRVQQYDWNNPLRGDWICQLENALGQVHGPVLLVAHSLGCHLAAGWAEVSSQTGRVQAALLVAPPDLSRADLPAALHTWMGHALQPLPFPVQVLSSSNDPYCCAQAAAQLAAAWGAGHVDLGPLGHINTASGLGNWPQGRAWLQALADGSATSPMSARVALPPSSSQPSVFP
jgi:predicted alpha/beta hydrolase family esterase